MLNFKKEKAKIKKVIAKIMQKLMEIIPSIKTLK